MNEPGGQPPVRTVLVLGGASDIGLAIVERLGRAGRLRAVTLAARDPDALTTRLEHQPLPADDVDLVRWDVLDIDAHAALVDRARRHMGGIDVVVCAVGSLGHHAGLGMDPAAADTMIRTNFSGPAAALLATAEVLRAQGHGTIVVLSSIAAARARRSNFVYGSSKAGLDAFAQGLGDALADTGVRVHVVRPGFVVSKMTAGLDPAPMASTPDAVADAVAGVIGSTSDRIVWVPGRLGPMMALLRNAPRGVWRRVAANR